VFSDDEHGFYGVFSRVAILVHAILDPETVQPCAKVEKDAFLVPRVGSAAQKTSYDPSRVPVELDETIGSGSW